MVEFLFEITSDEYRKEFREMFRDFLVKSRFRNLNSCMSTPAALRVGPTHAVAAPEPPVSFSACLFVRTAVQIQLKDCHMLC